MKVAAIDIGTNSIRLLKAEVNGKELISGDKALIMTRIGQGVNETGKLSPEAIERSVEALDVFAKEARAWGAEKVYALATSAVRDAENGPDFTARVKRECGLEVEVISGTHEARLGYLGVLAGLSQLDGRVLIIDVGGGSTELIVGDAKGIIYSKSINVGAVRMTGKHISTDPVSHEELGRVQADIDQLADEALKIIQTHGVRRAIGIGGTATTLGAMQLEMETYDRFKIQNSAVTLTDISTMNQELAQKTVEERKTIKGLQPKRADIILAGALIIEHVLTTLRIPTLFISDYDNLEGCLVERLIG
jgi:exopolyphosphatase/guanosine-5'-triphosphate,3'-diphosphate pyrophosphatase